MNAIRQLEPYARNARYRTPREVLSELAGRGSWCEPLGGSSCVLARVMSRNAMLAMAISAAGVDTAEGAALAAAIAMPDAASIEELRAMLQARMTTMLSRRQSTARLVNTPKKMLRAQGVLRHVLADLVLPGTGKDTRGMRRADYLELYREMWAEADALAGEAEAKAVRYLRGA